MLWYNLEQGSVIIVMSDLNQKKISRLEFLRIFGLSSASLLASGSLADEILSKARNGIIPATIMIKPNALLSGYSTQFSSIVVLPKGYRAADIDVSSVMCEGAGVLDVVYHPDGRTAVFIHNSDNLRDDLPCGLSLPFAVTGQLSDGSTFEGSSKVSVINASQPIIYHTSSRRRSSCRACKSHAVNRMYSSVQAADDNRAHPGCNCRVVEERISWQNYVKAFWHDSRGGIIVYDRRWGWPPPSPSELNLEYPPILKEHLRRG